MTFGGFGGSGGWGGGVTAASPTLVNVTLIGNRAGATTAGAVGGPGGAGGTGGAGFVQGGHGGKGGDSLGGYGGAGGNGGAIDGGSLTHVTVAGNSVSPGGAAGAGGTAGPGGNGGHQTGGSNDGLPGDAGASTVGNPGADGLGGGVFASTTTYGAAVLADSILTGDTPTNCVGEIQDAGHDLVFPAGGCPGTEADPQLGPLQDNGGLVETERLAPGSPAIDLVPAVGVGCPGTDARGAVRPQGPACDAGAYEVAPPGAATGPATAVTGPTATITGTVDRKGLGATIHFDFGPTTAYRATTADTVVAPGTDAAVVTASLTGLQPGTIYHYRLVAANADGASTGKDATFATGPVLAWCRSARRRGPSIAPAPLSTRSRSRAPSAGRRSASSCRSRRGSCSTSGARRRAAGWATPVASRRARTAPALHALREGRRVRRAREGRSEPKRSGGRIGRRTLAPGAYRAAVLARDARRLPSKQRRVAFTVLRG